MVLLKILKKDVWGVKSSDGTVYREYNGTFYPIVYQGEIIEYKISGRFTTLYFSETPDSPIHTMHKRS